jgi:hypothetical protein
MTESQLVALLDAHDALVQSCVDLTLAFEEFLALYNDFPHLYALQGLKATPETRAVLKRSHQRIAFHLQVAGVLSGLRSEVDLAGGYGEASSFAPKVGVMRLQALVAQYPNFKAAPGLG